jgi:peptidoglycan hydrolase-like protein with peptidoglycan-binding domain
VWLDSQDPSAFGWRSGPAADIVPYVYRGTHSFPQGVARGTSALWDQALDLICGQPGFSLPDPNPMVGGCWGFEDRDRKGGNTRSFHAFGLALDVAAPWNPWNVPVPAPSAHRMPRNAGQLIAPLGMVWGGDFRGNVDSMHIELHLSPGELADWPGLRRPPAEPGKLPPFPLPAGWYFGPRSGPDASVSNVWRPEIAWVAALAAAQRILGVPADGLYGPVTARATRSYQLAHGLVADGLIGVNTWRALAG